MVFSDSSGLTGLVEDIDFICTTDSTSYPLKDKARNINRHYYVAITDILKSNGRFQFDDSNLTSLPVSTTDMVASQQDYTIPTGLLKLLAVEVKDNGGNWVRLKEIDKRDLNSITDFENTPGMPKYYDVSGNTVMLYPAPSAASTTLTAGLKMHYQREVDHFASTDTTQEPGFAEPFHRILSLGASYDYLVLNSSQDKSDRVLAQYEALRRDLRDFYSTQNLDTRVAFRPVHRTANYI